MVWTTTLDGKCCERPQVSADGKTLVVSSNLQDYWYALYAKTGKLIRILHAPGSMGAHNLNLSADGKLAFMSPNGKLLQIADVETGKIVQKIQFPENVRVQALNKDLEDLREPEQFPGLHGGRHQHRQDFADGGSHQRPLAPGLERAPAPPGAARLPQPRHRADPGRQASLGRRRAVPQDPYLQQHRQSQRDRDHRHP